MSGAMGWELVDLSGLPGHVRDEHPGMEVPSGAGSRRRMARVHAREHHQHAVRHDHGGPVVSLLVAPGIWSVHPLGWFEGNERSEHERGLPKPPAEEVKPPRGRSQSPDAVRMRARRADPQPKRALSQEPAAVAKRAQRARAKNTRAS